MSLGKTFRTRRRGIRTAWRIILAAFLLVAAGGWHGSPALAEPQGELTIGVPGHLTITVPERISAGDTAVFDISYTNIGDRPLSSVELRIGIGPNTYDAPVNYGGMTWSDENGHTTQVFLDPPWWPEALKIVLTDLQPEDSERIRLSLPILPTYMSGPISVYASWTEYHAEGSDQFHAGITDINPDPPWTELDVSLDVSPKNRRAHVVTATLTVTNLGPAQATGARLAIDPSSDFIPLPLPGCAPAQVNPRVIECAVGTLAVGASVTKKLRLRVDPSSPMSGPFPPTIGGYGYALPIESYDYAVYFDAHHCTRVGKNHVQC